MEQVPRLLASRLSIRIAAPITITTGGEYRLGLDMYSGTATLLIDGQRRDAHGLDGGDAHARSARARRRGSVLADHAVDQPALERSRHAGTARSCCRSTASPRRRRAVPSPRRERLVRRKEVQLAALAAVVLLAAVLRVYAARRRARRPLLRRGRQRLQRLRARHRRHRRERHALAALRLVVRHRLQESGLHLRRDPAGEAARPERVQRPPRRGAVRHRHRRSRIFFLGRALFGPWVGLWAALFLAVAPWHLHFSRIAFELIAFPFVVRLPAACCWCASPRAGARCRRRSRCYALVRLRLRAGGVVRARVPDRLRRCSILPELLRHWRQFLLALVVVRRGAGAGRGVLLVARRGPAPCTSAARRSRSGSSRGARRLERFGYNYQQFFSPRFLVHEGDPIFRHAVRELRRALPVLHSVRPARRRRGAAAARPRQQAGAVVAGALSGGAEPDERDPERDARHHRRPDPLPAGRRRLRGGAARRCAGPGAAAPRWGAALQAARRRWRRGMARCSASQVARYLHAYFVDYPTYAALTPGAFQYGYRDAIQYMESERGNYDLLHAERDRLEPAAGLRAVLPPDRPARLGGRGTTPAT